MLDRLLALRDRWLASSRFQRWAAMLPFTRPIARRQARALFDLCAGFVYSQVLLACVRLRLFDVLAGSPCAPAVVAERTGLSPGAAERLLRAAAALGLVAPRRGGRFGLGVLGAALRGNPALGPLIEHHALLYADLQDPVALLRGERPAGALAGFWPYAGTDRPAALPSDGVVPYSALMAASQSFIAAEILDAYPMRQHRCLLDVGGGAGVFLAAAAERWPKLRLMLADLPAVAALAQARFDELGLRDRAVAHALDFLVDPLPNGADLVSIVRVLHDHDDAAVLAILQAAHRALPIGGTLLVAEPLAGTPGAEPVGDAYFGFYLLAMGSGRARTVAEIGSLLMAAGFDRGRSLPTRLPLLTQVIAARRQA